MKDVDKKNYVERYEGRLKEFGYDPQTLGWGKVARQDIRFAVLAQEALKNETSSVLDIGCGFADLYDFLLINGWKGKYTGVDIVPGLVNAAKKRHPSIQLLIADINDQECGIETHDYVISSGMLNATLPSGENEAHIQKMLHSMFALAKTAVSVDFLSALVDFKKEGAWHTDPAKALNYGFALTKNVSVRHDYLRFEFALFLNKNNAVSQRKVFETFEEKLRLVNSDNSKTE